MASLARKVFPGIKGLNHTASHLNFSATLTRSYSVKGSKLVYADYGDPVKVIKKEDEVLNELKPNEILIKMLAAPVNPADINTIQGKYPARPALPAVPGNEGVGEIVQLGAEVKDLSVGDRIVPLASGLGTWRTHVKLPASDALSVPKKLGLVEAATLTVNPCTAYRMLRDFTNLKPGDVIIQNGANSTCGQYLIQIAKVWGYKTVNVVRDRPEIAELKSFLRKLGATEVLTEEELRKTDLFKSGKMAKPRLALNCVGGKSALEVMRHLDKSAPIVTYGGMSREPLMVPTSALIFKDVQVRGFWMTEWSNRNSDSLERFEMFEELIAMMTNNELQGPAYKMVDFNDYKEALLNTMTIKGMIGRKYILSFDKK